MDDRQTQRYDDLGLAIHALDDAVRELTTERNDVHAQASALLAREEEIDLMRGVLQQTIEHLTRTRESMAAFYR